MAANATYYINFYAIARRPIMFNRTTKITPKDVATALGIAVVVDLLQVPGNIAFVSALFTGVGAVLDVPIELSDIGLDALAATMTSRLLGFHWALLPTCVLETIPGVDAAPTWTGCVLYVINQRKKDIEIGPPKKPYLDE